MRNTHRPLIHQAGPALALLAAALAAPAAPGGMPSEASASGLLRDIADADINTYTEHVHVLASAFMEGRKPGTPGIERAATYIQWHFEQLGLEPAFPLEETAADGQTVVTPGATYRQPFAIGSVASLADQSLTFSVAGSPRVLEGGTEFNALAYGQSGSLRGAPVVFVGYSIVAGQDDYTSYDGVLDLTGKVAMVLRFEPMDEEGGSAWADEGWSFAAALTTKFRAAESRGASAILLVTPPDADDERAGELETIESSSQGRPIDIPVIHVTPRVADAMIRLGDAQGRSLDELIAASNTAGVIAELGNVTVDLDAEITRTPITSDNLGAVLPGRGELADEYVVIGAHYDHLGVSTYGSRFPGELHLGADDNASGSAGLLTAAKTLVDAWDEIDGPVRSVLFLAFSAEETGLNGSRHYVENPIAPIEQHTLMVNLDMIGSLSSHLEAGGVGTGEGLEALAAPLFERSGIDIRTNVSVGSGRSDHASFDRRGVPNLFFFTGVTDQYHTPDDTVDTLNIDGAARIAHLAAGIAHAAARHTGEMAYVNAGGDDQGDRQRMGGPGGVKVRVGIAPGDYSGASAGIVVARVFEGTSAADAGLREGDRIITWNGEKVTTVEDWMPLLAAHEPGDTIDVVIVRDGEEMTIPMTLKARQTTGG